MKRNFVLIMMTLCITLAGCKNKSIAAVKASTLGETSFTTGQAFDHRELCASTKWDTLVVRGRTIVEYRCDIRGLKEYEASELTKNTAIIQNRFTLENTQYQSNIDAAKALIAAHQAHDNGPSGIAEPTDAEIKSDQDTLITLGAEQAWLKSDNLEELAAGFGHKPASYDMSSAMRVYNEEKSAGENTEAVGKDLLAARDREVQEVQQEIASTNAEIQGEQIKLNQSAAADLAKAKTLLAGEAAHRADLTNREAADLLKLRANFDAIHTYELFQWVVQSGADPVLQYAGLELAHPNGSMTNMKYDNIDIPVHAIIDNTNQNASDYANSTGQNLTNP